MNEVYVISSEPGDEYKLQFTTDSSGIIAAPLLEELNNDGIEVIEVGSGVSKQTVLCDVQALCVLEQS